MQYTNTLTYDANGGTNPPGQDVKNATYPSTQSTHTITSSVPTPPVETGYTYTFDGWYDKATSGTKKTGSVTVGNDNYAGNQSGKLYAYYTKTGNTYKNTVKYDANGGSDAPADDTINVTYPNTKTNHTVRSSVPTPYDKPGYTVEFIGWYDAPTGGNPVTGSFSVGSDNKAQDQESTTLYAHYSETANTYTNKLIYNTNGGNGSTAPVTQSVLYPNTSCEIQFNDFTPTLAGYDFIG
ncbi:MAG: InlB B-repeat-containing protein [Clostridia bacterium]|nr:InlB B-repeat-containing protein [Clostridia bacterium]